MPLHLPHHLSQHLPRALRRPGPLAVLLPLVLAAWQGQATGAQALEEITVQASKHDLVGVADSASEGTVSAQQLANRPLLRPAEV
ncbi:MAG TPA: hypothetical protein VJ548_04220, partial [Azospira sp.]|nr:hypothetical protein [Azospira sp.]